MILAELMAIHHEVLRTVPRAFRRYLHDKINWKAQAICLLGGRGVGKTTLICQQLLANYPEAERALYFSADNINVAAQGLFKIAQTFFRFGGEALFIDEVHKYPNWAQEIKNIIDTYKDKKLIFSASSVLDLKKSKYDLSRRVVYYELKGLSFREYLLLQNIVDTPVLSIDAIISQHATYAASLNALPILKHFHDYLQFGYYPFFQEGVADYLSKVHNVIEKVLYEDIAGEHNLKQSSITVLKKLLWLVATSNGLVPNIDNISRNLGVSREMIYSSLEQLDQSGLTQTMIYNARGMRLARKPGKVYLENTSLLHAINGNLQIGSSIGDVRETFFVNQVSEVGRLNLHEQGDFIFNGQLIFEVGGQSKSFRQLKNSATSYLALDDITTGFGRKIPLYLFGFLY